MSRFNLIDEKWIPVRFLDGSYDELGIRDTLSRSKMIAAIEDPSPLVVAALHRFLLAILYRALEGPTDIDKAKALFKAGLPSEKITAYLEAWRGRFWLFDEKYPFGQIPTFAPKIWRAWTAIAAEHNADNAKVLFDHVDVEAPGSISESAAARWILATQTFSVSCGKSELSHTGTAPAATAAMVLPLGCDLQDTLLLSLVPQNREITSTDHPLWERSPESVEVLKKGVERASSGYSDRYTWRIRSIFLEVNDSGRVERLAFASGVANASKDQTDPMLGYRVVDEKGKLPIQFRDRGLWRDFDSLLPDGSRLAPQVIEHATALTRSDQKRFPRSVMVLGQANNKAKIEYWRMERFALPEALAGDRSIRTEIRQFLKDAEEAQKSLWLTCRSFARDLLSRGEREPTGRDITGFVEQMPVNSWYWATLESRFHEILREYTLDRHDDDIRCLWLKFVRDTLKAAWNQHRASVSMGDAWTIRALVKAEGPLWRKLRELETEILKDAFERDGAGMSGFIEWLEKLNTSDTKVRAVLRRSLAFDPGGFVRAYPYVEPFVQDHDNSWRREMLYLVAGLWAAHWREDRSGQPMSLGKACAAYQAASGSTSTERRFINLLDSDSDQLPHRLRQMIALLKEQAIDFDDLLMKLLYWNDDQKRTQNSWARDFYRNMNADIENDIATQEEMNK